MQPARQILCIHLPHWPITRRLRRTLTKSIEPHRESHIPAVAVVRTMGQKRIVVDASAAAQRIGIKPGINTAEAKAIYPHLCYFDDDPAADLRSLEVLGRWLTRFTPIVSCQSDEDCNDPPVALWLDLTGCERLFGGIANLADLIAQSLRRFNIPAHLAVAPTVGSAWAFAKTSLQACVMVDLIDLHRAILPLPISTLRLCNEALVDLDELGLVTVGEVLALPRKSLPARFGSSLSKRLDQLTGLAAEPLTKLIYDPPVTASYRFDTPIESPEQITAVCEQLLKSVLQILNLRGHGARRLRLIFMPDRGWDRPIVKREIALSRPHRHRKTLLELIVREIERIDCEHGFVAFRLDIPIHEAITEYQPDLFAGQRPDAYLEFEMLLQRLRGRLGGNSVIRPYLVESYLPERAWRPAKDDEITINSRAYSPPRPLTLFSKPIELLVVCEPSDDRTGQPRQFTWQQIVHRLTHVIGPERIAGEWWREHRRMRDYFEVEDEVGQRFWILRVLSVQLPYQIVARWFLHGQFS